MANVFSYRFYVLGYLIAPLYNYYRNNNLDFFGYKLSSSLPVNSKLSTPLFLAFSKDKNDFVSYSYMSDNMGSKYVQKVKEICLTMYNRFSGGLEDIDYINMASVFTFGLDSKQDVYLCGDYFTFDTSFYSSIDYYNENKSKMRDSEFLSYPTASLAFSKLKAFFRKINSLFNENSFTFY
jgi:phosphoribosylaminoimidazole-succinocarboxamide synthase